MYHIAIFSSSLRRLVNLSTKLKHLFAGMLQDSLVYFLLAVSVLHTSSCAIPNPTGNLEVYALPVGQGDCTVIQCPAGQLIVNDCGSSGGSRFSAQDVRDYLGSRVNDIKAIFISHANRDHYSYLPIITSSQAPNIDSVIIGGVLTDYPVGAIRTWLNGFSGINKLRVINNGNGCIGDCVVTGGTDFCSNANIAFNILAVNVGTSANEKSIVLRVSTDSFSILLPGDMEGYAAETIATNLTVTGLLQVGVYKMAHHGAINMANQPEWLAPIRPVRAFASSAYNRGNCRHPRCEAVNNLLNLNTISPAPPHAFYCGNSNGPTNDPAFARHIYETSPTADLICLLTYSSNGSFSQDCMSPPAMTAAQTSEEMSGGVEEDGCGGSTAVAAHYSAIVVVVGLLLSWAVCN